MTSADQYCRHVTAQSGSSFYHTFRFLPPERRRAITALYAFCRLIDDTVDLCADRTDARASLASWRREVSDMFAGKPTHLVTKALQPHLARYQMQERHMQALIDGVEMDLGQHHFAHYAALQDYCWHVAGVVGMLSASIFGVTNPRTLQYAERLGTAFQLINIIRDVGEDARNGRIYLPQDELRRFGVRAADLADARHGPAFELLMQHQAERARQAYDDALALLPLEDRRAQLPGLMMAAIYRTLLDKIERASFQVLEHRISLSSPHKLWLALATYLGGPRHTATQL
jgi:phytoene synthase